MQEVTITVDIYGTWEIESPKYRIYINDEMMCERYFYAVEHEFFREKMLVQLEQGITYTFRLEQIPNDNYPNNRVGFKNLTVNGKHVLNEFTVPN